ncbi:MAG: response regulator transcription factor [Deltaproteobacteria bacterium]|nr:response regulator transcription factor [Deltaproteobacteria bacterium]
MARILIVEDDQEIASLLETYLGKEGYQCEIARDGEAGLAMALARPPALVVLDLMLPLLPGIDVLKKIRRNSRVPVIVLTARGEDKDRIAGLELGADDYLPKPFNPRELAARIKAVLRRVDTPPVKDTLRFGPLVIDLSAYTATLDGKAVELTTIEFAILRELALAYGRVMSREVLLERVRNREFEVFDRSIDVHVSHVRQKLGDDAKDPRWIKTVRGVGYLFVPEKDGI